ncbi:SLC13 family permease [Paracoccus versutus]|uniref:Di/tricarboxylate transporter n=1 Tax=Paracoccus versutus TaxID=34007 RepID=A0AAQ0HM71_PARVE|nr:MULTISPECIES: SLC13 family permease [Paracoccus]WGR60930.1 SLC13 family permease [Paracoccus ferrooxidans]KGJ03672.1 sodium:sulfate symporter [Paracoccus versutus]MCJ1900846.1 anion permease [Paracoccus versutus]MDF3906104.1 SLC13 family permease [Paracoccus sp. AS002]RDD71615.1 SLC13 family permease [Paracoccus versutus]
MKLSTRPLVFLASLVLAVLLAVGPVPQPLGRNAAVVLVTLALWSTGLVPPFLTSLIFFAAVLIPGLAPPELVFAGFGSAAVWLIVSGFVIGAAITGSGLGGRIAGVLAPLAGGSYLRLVAVMTLAAMALGFVMPSSVGRAVVLVPVGMALAERLGLHKGSNGRIGLAVALTLACNMPSFAILPSNIPNMILAGAAEGQHGVTFGYMSYLLLHYPVLGIAKSALTVALIVALFPDRIEAGSAEATPRAPLSPQERRVALILAATLALWMTDRLHGVGPAWIGIATAALLLMPGLGAVPPKQFNASVDFGMVLFVAGALALGAVVNASGLGSVLGGVLQDWLPLHQGASFVNFLSLTSMSGLMGLVTTNPGVPTVLTPMAPDLAAATGLSLKAVLMTQVVGFATVIFPYQVGPLVLAMQLSGEKLGHVLRITVPLAVLTFLVLMPLDWLWWRLLGWL